MSLCYNSNNKTIGSLVIVQSDRIIRACEQVLKAIKQKRDKEKKEYYDGEIARIKKKQKRFSWFLKQKTDEEIVAYIDKDLKDDYRKALFIRCQWEYAFSDDEHIANSLLRVAKKEKKLFLSEQYYNTIFSIFWETATW